MKKYIPHILIGLILMAVILLVIKGSGKQDRTQLNEQLSFFRKDKIPYGDYVAYQQLEHIFPDATISVNRDKPGEWDSLSPYDEKQTLIIISPEFNANTTEMRSLISFVEKGNDVFLSTMYLPKEVSGMLKCEVAFPSQYEFLFGGDENDTLTVSLAKPPFSDSSSYTYPGKEYQGYFTTIDTDITTILGHNEEGSPDFIQLKAGKGNFYVHLAPMAFTNYFLLHKKNLAYYEKTMSLISPHTNKVVWDEYYRLKEPERPEGYKKKNWLSVLLNLEIKTDPDDPANGKKPIKIAFWLLILLLLLYVLNEMRRKQRFIPIFNKPGNDSLDFIKTIGRLYYDKGDHANLCKKMAAYFLEHVRNRYKLPTNELNDVFVQNLHNKTGIPQQEISDIVSFIMELRHTYTVSDKTLSEFHNRLESFYNKE